MSPTRRVLSIVVVVGLAGLFMRLGFWQLSRHAERKSSVETRLARSADEPLVWTRERPPPRDTAGTIGRQVTLEGRYLYEHEVVLRSRSSSSRAGVELLTPFEVSPGGAVVLVLRGWLPAADGLRADLATGRPEASIGESRVEGVLITSSDGRGGQPLWIESAGREHLALGGIDLDQVRDHLPLEISPHVVRAADPPPGGGLGPARSLEIDAGPHLSYAIQWFSFAVIGVVGTAIVFRKERTREPPKVL